MPNLIVLNGLRRGVVFPVETHIMIGRDAQTDLRLADFLVSGRHAEITVHDGLYLVHDQNSTNGTLLNGQLVTGPTALTLGDVLLFGSTEVLFTDARGLDSPLSAAALPVALQAEADDLAYDVRVVGDSDEDLRLPDETEVAGPEIAVVRSVQRAFGQAWDLEQLLERIALHFAMVAEARGVAIVFKRESETEIVFGGTLLGDTVVPNKTPEFAIRTDTLERALREPKLLIARGGKDAAVTSVSPLNDPNAESPAGSALSLCVSLPTGAGIVGAVYLYDVRPDLRRSDLRLLLLLGRLAGVHLRNRQLLQELRTKNERLVDTNQDLENARAVLKMEVDERTAELGAAERQRRLLARIVENVQEAVVSINLDGEVTSWNPGAEALYGYPADELLGQILPTVPDSRSDELERILAAVTVGQSLAVHTERLTHDDELVPVHCTFAPVAEPGGEIVGLVEIARDRRLELREEERRRWRERLATFGELTSGLAHELGNPLNNLRSGVEWLLARDRPQETQRQSLEMLHKEILRLQGLVSQALKLGRWKPPVPKSVDVQELLEYGRATLAPRAEEAGVRLELIGNEGEARLQVLGDADQLKQALLNLSSNALEAMPGGGDLELGVLDEGELGGFWVRDTGVGIAAEDQARIFDLFFSQRQNGSGIGLSLVKRIIDLHEGKIEVESERGAGTVMRVLLPRPEQDASQERVD